MKNHRRFSVAPLGVFFADNVGESQQRYHLCLNHSNSEWTEKSFITINSAIAEAMELLQGIKWKTARYQHKILGAET